MEPGETKVEEEMVAEVAAAARRHGIPFDQEQMTYVAGCVAALRVSAARIRQQERNDEPAFGFRHPPTPTDG